MYRVGLGYKVKIRNYHYTTPAGDRCDRHVLHITTWFVSILDGKNPEVMVGGLGSASERAQNLRTFWHCYKLHSGDHDVFAEYGDGSGLDNIIPVAWHGDEGRGKRRGNTVCVSMEAVIGVETALRKKRKATQTTGCTRCNPPAAFLQKYSTVSTALDADMLAKFFAALCFVHHPKLGPPCSPWSSQKHAGHHCSWFSTIILRGAWWCGAKFFVRLWRHTRATWSGSAKSLWSGLSKTKVWLGIKLVAMSARLENLVWHGKTCQNSRFGLLRGSHIDRGQPHLQCCLFLFAARLRRSSTSVTHFIWQKLAFTETSLAAASAGWSKRVTMDWLVIFQRNSMPATMSLSCSAPQLAGLQL